MTTETKKHQLVLISPSSNTPEELHDALVMVRRDPKLSMHLSTSMAVLTNEKAWQKYATKISSITEDKSCKKGKAKTKIDLVRLIPKPQLLLLCPNGRYVQDFDTHMSAKEVHDDLREMFLSPAAQTARTGQLETAALATA